MPPGKPPAPIADEARLAAEQLDVYLAPGPAERIARVIAGTLRVYFDRDFEAGDEIAIEFWLADLADLPAWAVEKACASWRRLEEKRPTPANIRALAFKELREHHETQRRLRATLAAA